MTFSEIIGLMIVCGTVMFLALLTVVSLPQSPVRALLVHIFGWLFAGACTVYCISPIDILPEALLGPFGLPDDLAAFGIGVSSAVAAWQAGKDRVQLRLQEKDKSAA